MDAVALGPEPHRGVDEQDIFGHSRRRAGNETAAFCNRGKLRVCAPALEEERARREREEEEEANRTREVAATAEAAQSRLIILISRGVTDFGQATDQSHALHLLDGIAQRLCRSATRCPI